MDHRGLAFATVLTAGLSACAVQTHLADPFAGGVEAGRPSGRLQRVRLEVICGGCAVTYSIAARTYSVTTDGPVWRTTLDRYPRFPEAVRLTASGEVEAVRIYANGVLAASQERRAAGSYGTLSVEAVVPLNAEAPPDTLDSEGARGGVSTMSSTPGPPSSM